MVYSTKHAVNEATHAIGRTGRYASGLFARSALKMLTGLGVGAAGVGGAGAWFGVGLFSIGTGVGLHAYLNHKDYEHNIEQLAGMYEKEISASLGKDINEVGLDDLKRVAQKVPSLQKQLDREKTKRNVRTGIWVACAVVGLAAATAIMATMAPAAIGIAAATSATAGAGAGAAFGAKILAVMGALTSFRLSQPLVKNLAENSFDLNAPSTVEIVKSLEWKRSRGQMVSQAQVMEVYVSAMPRLAEHIEKNFDRGFMELDIGVQQQIIGQYGPSIKLDEVTQAINENRLNARELTFRVHNQVSGAYADPTYREQLNEGFSVFKGKAKDIQQNIAVAGHNALSTVKNFVTRTETPELIHDENLEANESSTKWRDTVTDNRRLAEQATSVESQPSR